MNFRRAGRRALRTLFQNMIAVITAFTAAVAGGSLEVVAHNAEAFGVATIVALGGAVVSLFQNLSEDLAGGDVRFLERD